MLELAQPDVAQPAIIVRINCRECGDAIEHRGRAAALKLCVRCFNDIRPVSNVERLRAGWTPCGGGWRRNTAPRLN